MKPIDKFIEDVKELIETEEMGSALELLKNYLGSSSKDLETELILHTSKFNRLKSKKRKRIISDENFEVQLSILEESILDFLKVIPRKISAEVSPSPSTVELSKPFPELDDFKFEKVLGINNLKQISWVQQGIDASKCVCRIRTPNGFGSGFIIAPNLIMTNNHVIKSSDIANQSFAEFNYQQDAFGKHNNAVRYRINGNIFKTSPKGELDYTIVGLYDDDNLPLLEKWGIAELNPNAVPYSNEHVIIIQHPNGGLKQVALTNNRVINIENQFLRYTTDTMPGSSGSPVFNDSWKVVGIHHAYGGAKKDSKGDLYYTNEGILMSHIKKDAKEFWPDS